MHISHGVTLPLQAMEDQTSVFVLVLGPAVLLALAGAVVYWLKKRA